jgi:hypothetical protein
VVRSASAAVVALAAKAGGGRGPALASGPQTSDAAAPSVRNGRAGDLQKVKAIRRRSGCESYLRSRKALIELGCALLGCTCRQPQAGLLRALKLSLRETNRSVETRRPTPLARSPAPNQNGRSVYLVHGQPRNPLLHLAPPVLNVSTRSRSPPLSRSPRLVPANIPPKLPGRPPAALPSGSWATVPALGVSAMVPALRCAALRPFRNLIPILITRHRKKRQ